MEKFTSEMIKVINGCAKSQSAYAVFADWVNMFAISIRNNGTPEGLKGKSSPWKKAYDDREEEFKRLAAKYDPEEMGKLSGMLILELERDMRDVLGEVFMDGGFGNKAGGQFFTPPNIQAFTACLAISNEEIAKYKENPNNPIELHEPSIGSGGMVIEAVKRIRDVGVENWQKRIKVIGQDLEWRCVHMAYVQLSLLGIDAVIYQGDTLSEPGNRNFPPERIWRSPRNAGMLLFNPYAGN